MQVGHTSSLRMEAVLNQGPAATERAPQKAAWSESVCGANGDRLARRWDQKGERLVRAVARHLPPERTVGRHGAPPASATYRRRNRGPVPSDWQHVDNLSLSIHRGQA